MANIFNRKKLREKDAIEKAVGQYFGLLTAYSPVFTTFEGSVYEAGLCRAAIHSFAQHASMLEPRVYGSADPAFANRMRQPNELMNVKQYLYRLATVYKATNNAFIAPVCDDAQGEHLIGFYPLVPSKCELVTVNNTVYLRYNFAGSVYGAIEFDRVGRMMQYYFRDEIRGEGNESLRPTMDMIHAQNEGIVEGVKSSAFIRFLARAGNVLKDDTIKAEQKRFRENALNPENNGGVMIFDSKYADVKQVNSTPFVVDDKQMQIIRDNVYMHFGTNEKIIKNEYSPEQWSAYCKGEVEPFALEASLVHTRMKYTEREISSGNKIYLSSGRLDFISTQDKIKLITDLRDRGMISANEGRELLGMTPIGEDGDVFYIRRDYATVKELQAPAEPAPESETNNAV